MIKIYSKILFGLLIISTITQSCKKQLDIRSRTSIDADIALSNRTGIENAINSIYSILKRETHYGRDLFSVTEALADDAFANGRSSRLISENRNNNLANVSIWGGSYAAINEINLTLAAAVKISDATEAEQKRWKGELHFLRALYFFDLVKNYAYIPTFVVPAQDRGGIVITLEGFNSAAAAVAYYPSRSSIAESYQQILNDLYTSIPLLANNGRGTGGINYASKHAALALGSRIALYQGNWERADSFATAAIGLSGGLGTMSNTANYVTGWRNANHPEAIFQVFYATLAENLGVNTSLAATHTTLAVPGDLTKPRQGQGDLVPNGFLLNSLGISGFPAGLASSTPAALTYSNDIRNKLFEWGVNAAGHYIECTKWLGKSGNANWDNTVVLRWPELYLNRAEAKYHRSDETGAWNDLNVIRAARYVGFVAPVVRDLSGQALLDEILKQRLLEFAFEGHRFYDIKRYGKDIIKSNPVVNLPASDFRLLPRIPVGEVDGNVNMKQNFGY